MIVRSSLVYISPCVGKARQCQHCVCDFACHMGQTKLLCVCNYARFTFKPDLFTTDLSVTDHIHQTRSQQTTFITDQFIKNHFHNKLFYARPCS